MSEKHCIQQTHKNILGLYNETGIMCPSFSLLYVSFLKDKLTSESQASGAPAHFYSNEKR